ncbi:MAG: endonuclease V [Gaiellales bacterium]
MVRARRALRSAVVSGEPGAPYVPGHLAFREGPLLERAVRELDAAFDVLLVNATGRDHPRGAGLAFHLGAVLDVPTAGVTDRRLVAEPAGEPGGARTPERNPAIRRTLPRLGMSGLWSESEDA